MISDRQKSGEIQNMGGTSSPVTDFESGKCRWPLEDENDALPNSQLGNRDLSLTTARTRILPETSMSLKADFPREPPAKNAAQRTP